MDLVVEDDSRVGAAYFLMSEDNIRKQIALPWVSFGSDEESSAPEGVFTRYQQHPRAYGNFARVLARYVRDERAMPLETAVRKLAALPAENLGLKQRGRLQPGYLADVVIFDPARIQDHATFDNPRQYATGMVHVFVNGIQVLRNGEHTGAKPGRVVRGPGWKGSDRSERSAARFRRRARDVSLREPHARLELRGAGGFQAHEAPVVVHDVVGRHLRPHQAPSGVRGRSQQIVTDLVRGPARDRAMEKALLHAARRVEQTPSAPLAAAAQIAGRTGRHRDDVRRPSGYRKRDPSQRVRSVGGRFPRRVRDEQPDFIVVDRFHDVGGVDGVQVDVRRPDPPNLRDDVGDGHVLDGGIHVHANQDSQSRC